MEIDTRYQEIIRSSTERVFNDLAPARQDRLRDRAAAAGILGAVAAGAFLTVHHFTHHLSEWPMKASAPLGMLAAAWTGRSIKEVNRKHARTTIDQAVAAEINARLNISLTRDQLT